MLPTDLIGLAVVEFATEPSSWQSALRRWSTWVLVCSVGGTAATVFVGILVSYVLPTILALNNGPIWFATLALGVGVAAALFAMPQWIVLRHQIPHASRWIITTAWSGILGVVLAFISFFPIVGTLAFVSAPIEGLLKVLGLNPNLPDSVLSVTPGALTGVIVGISQARILAPTIKYPGRWVLASTLGATALVIGAGTGVGLNVVNPTLDGLVVGSIAYGITTGIAVAGLFGRVQSQGTETPVSGTYSP